MRHEFSKLTSNQIPTKDIIKPFRERKVRVGFEGLYSHVSKEAITKSCGGVGEGAETNKRTGIGDLLWNNVNFIDYTVTGSIRHFTLHLSRKVHFFYRFIFVAKFTLFIANFGRFPLKMSNGHI